MCKCNNCGHNFIDPILVYIPIGDYYGSSCGIWDWGSPCCHTDYDDPDEVKKND